VGLGEGILIGAKNAIVAVADLVKLIIKLEIEYLKFLGREVPKIPSGLWDGLQFIQSEIGEHFSDHDKALKDDLAFLQNTGTLVKEIGGIVTSVLGIIPELFKEGKNLIFGEISKSLRKWAAESAFEQGKDVGSLIGQIIFEVLIALIGAKGTDKIAKLAEGGRLGIIFKSSELEKVTQAIEKLNAVKSRLNGLLEGTKYADVTKLLAERKNIVVQKAVQEILQDVTKQGLKEVPDKVAEQAIRKVVKESLSELEKKTGKKISKEVLEDITEKSVGEVKKEVLGTRGQLKQLSAFIKFSRKIDAETWGNKYFRTWEMNLSPTEKQAITDYTGDEFYPNINRTLRGLEKEFNPGNHERVTQITNALNKASMPEGVTVYRGVGKDALGELKDLAPEQLIGKVIEDKAFMSTSLVSESAFKQPVTFIINVPKGVNGAFIGNMSHYGSKEVELLLNKGQKMVIQKVIDPGTNHMKIICELI
ncbi:MAG TPA: hypothetical protein DDW50_07495, partial [Firmicutes bacterium]|nr:hypothetical protein [Bacillota bacterium]